MLNILPEQISFGNGPGHKQNDALVAAASGPIVSARRAFEPPLQIFFDRFNRWLGFTVSA